MRTGHRKRVGIDRTRGARRINGNGVPDWNHCFLFALVDAIFALAGILGLEHMHVFH